MDISTVTYAILVAIILYVIYMHTSSNINIGYNTLSLNMKPIQSNTKKIKNKNKKKIFVNYFEPMIDENPITTYTMHPKEDDISYIDEYLQDIAFGRKFRYSNTNKKSSKKKYIENFWNFNDEINVDSNGGVDVVDKINEIGNEHIGGLGDNIADVFNNLTSQ